MWLKVKPARLITSSTIGMSRSAWPVSKRSSAPENSTARSAPVCATQTEQASKQVSKARTFIASSLYAARPLFSTPRGACGKAASGDLGHLSEGKPRRTRHYARPVAVAEIAQEIRLDAGAGEKCLVHAVVVEARHRPGIEAQRARRKDQVGALQGPVAKGRDLDLLVLADKPAPRVGVRETASATARRIPNRNRRWRIPGPASSSRGCLRSRDGLRRSLASFDFTKMKRAGEQLALVGPILSTSTSRCRRASGTSFCCHLLCVRASRKSCFSAASSMACDISALQRNAWRDPNEKPRSFGRGSSSACARTSGSGAQAARTSCTSGQKCRSRFSMPCRSVAVELGQPEQAPRMCR